MEKFEELEIGVQKKMLINCFRQRLERESDKEEFGKLCKNLENEANVALLVQLIMSGQQNAMYQ